MNHMARRISLDTIPSAPVGMAAQHLMRRNTAPETAVQWNAPAWCVLACDYQADEKAQRRLDTLGLEARLFRVQRRLPRTSVRPEGIAHDPAFPGYLIVRVAPDEAHLCNKDYKHGIEGLLTEVGNTQRPAFLPDVAMAVLLGVAEENAWTGRTDLLAALDHTGRVMRNKDGSLALRKPSELYPRLDGSELEIVAHPWAEGLKGLCVKSSPERVVVLLSMLGGERRVEVKRTAVRPA